MGDILSREEIEALLKKETDKKEYKGKNVRAYDFRSPFKLSKDYLRVLNTLIETFSAMLKSKMSAYLKTDCTVSIISMKQATFEEFLNLTPPTFIAIFEMKPMEGLCCVEINSAFLLFLIENLLGGKANQKTVARELTSLERAAACGLTEVILNCFKESFKKVVEFEPKIIQTQSDPKFVEIATKDEIIFLLKLEMNVMNVVGEINICLSQKVLESLLPSLSFKKWLVSSQKKEDSYSKEKIYQNLGNIGVTVVCELGNCELTFGEFYSLKEGDCLRLDKTKDSLLELKIGGSTKFYVQPGLVGKRIAVKIISVAST